MLGRMRPHNEWPQEGNAALIQLVDHAIRILTLWSKGALHTDIVSEWEIGEVFSLADQIIEYSKAK